MSSQRSSPHGADEPDVGPWRSRPGRALAELVVRASDKVRGSDGKPVEPRAVLLVIAAIGLGLAAVLTVLSAAIYESVTDREGVAGLDRPALDTAIGWRSRSLDLWVTHLTDLGSLQVMPFVAVGAASLVAWWWRSWTPLLLFAVAAAGSLVLTVVGKAVVGRSRPAHELAVPPYETSPSFPSGHSLNSWVVFGLLAYLVALKLTNRLLQVVTVVSALILAAAVGLSRVFLGHHWLTDVLVAWALGSAWLVVVITGHRLAVTVRRHRRASQSPASDVDAR